MITIFSASNYYEIGSNKGAYLKLNPQLDTHFVQYTSAASKTRKLTFRQKVGLVESSAIRELGAKLREHRNDLEREFKARDPDLKGNKTFKAIWFSSYFFFFVFHDDFFFTIWLFVTNLWLVGLFRFCGYCCCWLFVSPGYSYITFHFVIFTDRNFNDVAMV